MIRDESTTNDKLLMLNDYECGTTVPYRTIQDDENEFATLMKEREIINKPITELSRINEFNLNNVRRKPVYKNRQIAMSYAIGEPHPMGGETQSRQEVRLRRDDKAMNDMYMQSTADIAIADARTDFAHIQNRKKQKRKDDSGYESDLDKDDSDSDSELNNDDDDSIYDKLTNIKLSNVEYLLLFLTILLVLVGVISSYSDRPETAAVSVNL